MFCFDNIKKLLNLAYPLIIGNLGIVLIGFCDVFVAGRYSTDALASVAIGNSILTNVFLFGISLLSAISPLLSNFRGEKQSIKKYFFPTISFAMLLALVICLASIATIPFVDYLGFEKRLVLDIKEYMFVCAFSNFGVYLFVSLKEYLQAYEIVLFPNFLNIFCVFLNLILNFIFVFGWGVIPGMGAVGLAWATVISRSLVGLILLLYCVKIIRVRYYKDYSYFKKLIKMGLPISGAVLTEMIAWNLVTIFIGRISGVYAAAQSILNTLSNATFMIPMAISNAIAVKVGFENGASNYKELKRYAFSGIGVSLCFMGVCAMIFILFPVICIEIFTKDVRVLEIAVPVLVLMGLFQLFDGLQISISGVFKGLKQTKLIMYGTIIGYWVFGLPLGYVYAFVYDMKLFGFYIGLTLAIAFMGISFLIMMIHIFKTMNTSKEIDLGNN